MIPKGSTQSVIALKKDERCKFPLVFLKKFLFSAPSLHEKKKVNYYVVNELDCCGFCADCGTDTLETQVAGIEIRFTNQSGGDLPTKQQFTYVEPPPVLKSHLHQDHFKKVREVGSQALAKAMKNGTQSLFGYSKN